MDVAVTHVKPHGALNNVACVDADVAAAICRAVQAVDDSLIVLAPAGSELLKAAEALDLPAAAEGFAYASERIPTSVLRSGMLTRCGTSRPTSRSSHGHRGTHCARMTLSTSSCSTAPMGSP